MKNLNHLKFYLIDDNTKKKPKIHVLTYIYQNKNFEIIENIDDKNPNKSLINLFEKGYTDMIDKNHLKISKEDLNMTVEYLRSKLDKWNGILNLNLS